MKQDLLKYRHYLILLSALLLVKFVTEPLWQQQVTQQANNALIAKQANKANALLDNHELLSKTGEQQQALLTKLLQQTFVSGSEAEFKLQAQSSIEQAVKQANCKVERIGWKGVTQVLPSLNRWQLEMRFSGEPVCILSATKALESLKPLVSISSYYYNGELNGNPQGLANARLQLTMWQSIKEGE